MLDKLRRQFGIKRLLPEVGGAINGGFVAANLIDEMSVVIAPIIDGAPELPGLIDYAPGVVAVRHLQLLSCQALPGNLLCLRCKVWR